MIELPDEAETQRFGQDIANALTVFDQGLVVSLAGELGAGKTALTRAVLRALGVGGTVVSPSYTLIEPYVLDARRLLHMDLYRLADPEELEFIGIRDIDPETDWLFVEWASRGAGFLPPIDVEIELAYHGTGRSARLSPSTSAGDQWARLIEQSR